MTDDIRFLHFLSSFREMSQSSAFINIVSLEVNSKSRFFMIFYKLFIIINIQNKIKKPPNDADTSSEGWCR